jgi:hybrid cluster-associated redox disulfide protein
VQTYTRDMLIRDVLISHEGVSGVFERHGLGCAQCMGADMETLAAVASMHEISVDVLLADLNDLVAEQGEA